MDNMNTRFSVADNSGAKEVGLIKIFRSNRLRIGNLILVSVKSIHKFSKVKKGEMYFAVIVRTRVNFRRDNNTYVRFNNNAVVLLRNRTDGKLVGTRLNGIFPIELKRLGYNNIISLAEQVI